MKQKDDAHKQLFPDYWDVANAKSFYR